MRPLRRIAAAAAVGLLRARSGGSANVLVVLGVAAAAGLLAAVLVGSTAAERRTLAHSIERLPTTERAVRVAWFGVPAQAGPLAELDAAARRSLGRLVPRRPARTVLVRESTIGGAFVALGAVDGLGRWVRLTSGRLPRSCGPSRCEVLQLRGNGRIPRGFEVVGRGALVTTLLFGDGIPADRNELEQAQLAPRLQEPNRYHQPAAPPLLLANGVDGLVRLQELRSSYRTHGWVVELEPADVEPWRVNGFALDVARARAALQGRSIGFEVSAPLDALVEARERAEVGGLRLLLLGGQAAALLLAFAAFAAVRLRRQTEEGGHRLSLLGVARWQRLTALGVQAAVLAGAGVVLAWALAVAAVAAIDADLVRQGLLDRSAATAALLLAAASAATVVAAGVARPPARTGRVTLLDGLALAILVAVAAALVRGGTDADRLLEEGRSGVFLLALPAAVVALAAIIAVRVLAPLARAGARRLPPEAPAARLALVSLARRPGVGAAAAGFLAVSVALALFAVSYRATLERGQREQAAFALGADFVLREDLRRLVPVRRVATEARLAGLGDDVHAAPVIRATGTVPAVGRLTGVTVLGLEPRLLASLRGAKPETRDLAAPAQLRGPVLPAGADTISVAGRASPASVTLSATVRRRDGGYEEVLLRVPGTATLPRGARGGMLLGFRVVPPPRLQERGADAGRPFVARLELGALTAGGSTVVDRYGDWIGVGGATFRDGRLDVTLTDQVVTRFRPRQPLDGLALPAVVSPAVAAVAGEGGELTLQVRGHAVRVRIARVAQRFPSTRGDFAVVDRAAFAAALDLAAPGSGFFTEVWANAGGAAAHASAARRLVRAPFDALVLDSRAAREEELRDDPLARASLAMLAVAAAAALLLALLALALATLSDLRDDRDELVELESQGAPPSLLRRLVRVRQLVTGLLGVGVGAVAGAALAALVVDVVAVSASAAPPVPPLRLSFAPAPAVAAVALAAAAAAVLLVLVATRRAFAAGQAGRPAEVE